MRAAILGTSTAPPDPKTIGPSHEEGRLSYTPSGALYEESPPVPTEQYINSLLYGIPPRKFSGYVVENMRV